jgi:hypothetical protein
MDSWQFQDLYTYRGTIDPLPREAHLPLFYTTQVTEAKYSGTMEEKLSSRSSRCSNTALILVKNICTCYNSYHNVIDLRLYLLINNLIPKALLFEFRHNLESAHPIDYSFAGPTYQTYYIPFINYFCPLSIRLPSSSAARASVFPPSSFSPTTTCLSSPEVSSIIICLQSPPQSSYVRYKCF